MALLDTLGWVFIGGAVLCYARQGSNPEHQPSTAPASGEDLIDLSRWRHNGDQPTYWKTNDQRAIEEEQVTEILGHF